MNRVANRSSSQPAAYFGGCQSDGSPLAGYADDFYGARYWYNDPSKIAYSCPGTGTRTVTELSAFCRTRSGTVSILLGICDDTGNLLYEGSGVASTSSGTNAWIGHTTGQFIDAGGSPVTPTLTGGSGYLLVLALQNALLSYTRIVTGVPTNATIGIVGDVTTGIPSTVSLAPGNGNTMELCVRCRVT